MNPIRFLFMMAFVFVGQLAICATDGDQPSAVPWYNLQKLETPFTSERQYVDTTHTGFQLYDFFSPRNPFVANKGNVGHASRQLRFEPDLSLKFLLFPAEPYEQYRFTQEHQKYYRPEHVFTDLYYVTGANREQLFYGMHTQRFHERLYASIHYRLVNSPGAFSRMGTRNSNVGLTIDYSDPAARYQLLGGLIVNRFENQESGGLRNHLAYEENPVRDSVYMYNAMSAYRETVVHLSHFYRTGFFSDISQVVENEQTTERRFVNLGRINHHFLYSRRSFVFSEDGPPFGYYPVVPQLPSMTFDSTLVQTVENQFSWSNFPMEREDFSFPFNFKLSMIHRYVDIRQPLFADPLDDEQTDDTDTYLMEKHSFSQFVPGVYVESDRRRSLSFNGFSRMTIGGYNDEDFDIGGNVYFEPGLQASKLQASAVFAQREATYFLSRFSGNHISWDQSFEKQHVLRVSGKWESRLVGIEGSYYLLGNMVFMNELALPEQNPEAFNVLSIGISLNPGLGVFRSRNQLLFQHAGSKRYDRFPAIVTYHSLYADLNLFQQALQAQIGFDLTYNAPYRPMAYMPVVRQFYIQDEFDSGHVFLLDAFLTAKIKRTRFFLKFQHILGMLTQDTPVYAIPYYPLPEAAFKFGVSWMFFD